MRNTRLIRGFTLVELLVVIAIIGMLVALLIPAVQAARERMRTAQCLNNVRNIATAIINFESSKQRFPGYVQPLKRSNGAYVGMTESTFQSIDRAGFTNVQTPQESLVAWSAVILDQIDDGAKWDILQDASATDQQMVATQIELYMCPNNTDLNSIAGSAGLTYVVNTGAWDRDAGGRFLAGPNLGDTTANGIFHNLSLGGPRTSSTDVKDGSATTIMVSENHHKDPLFTWLGVAPVQGGEQQLGMVWVVAYPPVGPPNAPSCTNTQQQARLGVDPDVISYPADLPCYARPAANHSGDVINVAFFDGSARGIDMSQMDYLVYQQLMCPSQSKCVDPEGHDNVDEGTPIWGFRTAPPLSEDAYK